jgi:hypothetical protein
MEQIVLILLGTSIILIIVSFFQKNPNKKMQVELDELSMQFLQENYQLKKRILVLEEELLGGPTSPKERFQLPNEKKPVHVVVKNQVIALNQQGVRPEQIAKQSALSVQEVHEILVEKGERL